MVKKMMNYLAKYKEVSLLLICIVITHFVLLSMVTFFHFITGFDLSVIENWIHAFKLPMLLVTKMVSLYFLMTIADVRIKNLLAGIRYKNIAFSPTITFFVMAFFLLINTGYKEVLNQTSVFSFVAIIFEVIMVFAYFLPEFFILYLNNSRENKNLGLYFILPLVSIIHITIFHPRFEFSELFFFLTLIYAFTEISKELRSGLNSVLSLLSLAIFVLYTVFGQLEVGGDYTMSKESFFHFVILFLFVINFINLRKIYRKYYSRKIYYGTV